MRRYPARRLMVPYVLTKGQSMGPLVSYCEGIKSGARSSFSIQHASQGVELWQLDADTRRRGTGPDGSGFVCAALRRGCRGNAHRAPRPFGGSARVGTRNPDTAQNSAETLGAIQGLDVAAVM